MLLAGLTLLLLASCASPRTTPPEKEPAPYLLLLGTAQDGGYPQLACDQPLCQAAREDPSLRRGVASALIVDPRSNKRWLLDATPDLPQQIELARGHAAPSGEGRPPLFDGIFLTHAHMGHYTGLMHLGRESYATQTTPLYATQRMGAFLVGNGPWSLLFEAGHLQHVRLKPGVPVQLAEDLTVTPFEVPHRPEFSDTVAFLIRGPNAAALYLPDIDKWERWEQPIEELISEVDTALLDGTFYDADELPGRSMEEIPHPFIVESIRRFGPLDSNEKGKIHFFHLNHSNPAIDASSAARREVREAGMWIAEDGDRFPL